MHANTGVQCHRMKDFKHEDQQRIWDAEHATPSVLLQMDSDEGSSGVKKFWEFLKAEDKTEDVRGVEMGCGKGRNVVWLAAKKVEMHGFDFSPVAIEEARRRAVTATVEGTHFIVQDATKTWNYESDSFDFAIDCFASTDIESPEGRDFAMSEFHRVLKPGGYLLAYLLSTDDEFHKEMIEKAPSEQSNAFHHPNGKFEKTFDENEIRAIYKDFKIEKWERVEKVAQFNGKDYGCKHHWLVLTT